MIVIVDIFLNQDDGISSRGNSVPATSSAPSSAPASESEDDDDNEDPTDNHAAGIDDTGAGDGAKKGGKGEVNDDDDDEEEMEEDEDEVEIEDEDEEQGDSSSDDDKGHVDPFAKDVSFSSLIAEYF